MNERITDDMVEAAIRAYFGDEHTWHVGMSNDIVDGIERSMRAALSAALQHQVGVKALAWGEVRRVPDAAWSETTLRQRIGHHNLGPYAGSYSVQEMEPGGAWGWWNTWTADRYPDGVEPTEKAAMGAAQADFEARIRSVLQHQASLPVEAWVLVPKEPTPKMLGAWYSYKNGYHCADEPTPRDTSDVGAYRAMLAAAPSTGGR